MRNEVCLVALRRSVGCDQRLRLYILMFPRPDYAHSNQNPVAIRN